MNIKHLAYSALSASILMCATQGANAAGFYIQEQSVKGLGTAFAGSTTSIDDASTIYFNPAGMTKLDGAQINAGVHLLLPDADLEDNGSTFGGDNPGNPYDPSPVPNLFAATPVDFQGREIWLGVGVTAPFGLASEYDETDFVAFDSTETELTTINVAPSIAYAVNDMFSIGGGIDVQYADAELKNFVNLGPGGTGISTLEGDDITVGYNLGLQLRPRTDTEIGLHYRSGISHTLDGSISLEGTLADFDIGGSADLDLPDIATFGIAHDINDRLRVMGQATWFGWSNFETIRAVNDAGAEVSNVEQDYQDTYAIAIGAEYDLSDQWTVRGGYQFDETPTTDEFRTSRTPDGDRNWFSAGATYNYSDKLSFDAAATYIDVDDGVIDVSRNGGTAQVTGTTEGSVGILAVGLNYRF